MDAQLIRKIENMLNQRKMHAVFEANKKKEELYLSDPELLKLETEKRRIACDRKLDKNEKQKLLNNANGKIASYLKAHGITLPEPQFKCNICQDTGYINGERCTCFTRLLIAEAMKDDGMLSDKTFENFDESIFDKAQRSSMISIKNYCMQYTKSFPNVKKSNIVLCGNTGTGKTFLLSCIASALKERGFSVIFITAGKMFDILRKYAFNKVNDIDALIDADMLIIDDIGTEPLFNNITLEYTFLLINERTRLNKPMCISTNLSPDEIKSRYTERISSRIFDQKTTNVLQLTGDDLRMRKC